LATIVALGALIWRNNELSKSFRSGNFPRGAITALYFTETLIHEGRTVALPALYDKLPADQKRKAGIEFLKYAEDLDPTSTNYLAHHVADFYLKKGIRSDYEHFADIAGQEYKKRKAIEFLRNLK
jgi:hypothetical protein